MPSLLLMESPILLQKAVPSPTNHPNCFIKIRPCQFCIGVVGFSPQFIPHKITSSRSKVEVISAPNDLMHSTATGKCQNPLVGGRIVPASIPIIGFGDATTGNQPSHMSFNAMTAKLGTGGPNSVW